ncbi:uncharacterized protein LTR77_007792 [Saxophila tyrrhenica]|uniref:Cyclin-domain-containing protein n=1 Tax=Saxophila tyrrhenica TaxID=1690608 RepID=A0AAV9P625_9PEZI|nr:hypothetical protein LTR77_007792 [Saxophila tyrrhenica]
MEDGVSNGDADTTAPRTPPPPPSPKAAEKASVDHTHQSKSDEPLKLENEQWDIWSISAVAALRMLRDALDTLAEATGDIPPTPPVTQPTTPNTEEDRLLALRRLSSPEVALSIGSPEAHPHEPLAVTQDIPDITVQHAVVARRFFSKTAPAFSLDEYLQRIHQYCPHSPGVYLAAASLCHRLCVADLKVPATNRTVHRLALAAIRVSAKAVEDNKWHQKRMAGVGGVSISALTHLEIALCYLLDFELWMDDKVLARGIFLLQQAARQGAGARGKLSDQFKLKLPLRKKMALAQG